MKGPTMTDPTPTAPQGEDMAVRALELAIEALTWHYKKNYLGELTDIPRKRDAKALRECKSALAAERAKPNPWRDAVDDALVCAGLDCTLPDDSPRNAIYRLVQWQVRIMLDPLVSSEAQALIDRGAAEEHAKPKQCLGSTDPDCNYAAICGQPCNKCGRVHRHHMMLARAAEWPAKSAAVLADAERCR
jgi:hypothetical protein